MRPDISLAIGAAQMTAVIGRQAQPVTVPWSFPQEAEELESALTVAFGAIASKLGQANGTNVTGAIVNIVLLPPLSQARIVQLPPLRRSEAQLVVQRDAARYFPGGTGPRAIAVRVVRAKTTAPTLAVAASAALIDHIRAAALTTGWRLGTVVPAIAAWENAAASVQADHNASIVAVVDDTAHVYTRVKGQIVNVRRVSAAADAIREAIGSATPAVLFADLQFRDELNRGLAASGMQPTAFDGNAADAAARFLAARDLQLLTPSLMVQNLARKRSYAFVWAAAAIALVLGAAALELWGQQRELVSVRQQRADIRPKVLPLLAARDSLNALQQRHAQIEVVATQSPRLTPALFDLGMVLPNDTHITSLRASGDTLIVEAEGGRAGDAIEALSAAPNLRDVKVRGTVDRELEDGSMAGERFTLIARLASNPDSAGRARASRPPQRAARTPPGTRGEL